MRHSPLVLCLLGLAAVAHADPKGCVATSGAESARCLATYRDAIEKCRLAGDAACETAARADGGALAATLAAVEAPIRGACTDEDAEALGFLGGQDDVVFRAREGCADFAEDQLRTLWTAGRDPACSRRAAKRLRALHENVLQLVARKCTLRQYAGRRCARAKRDRRLARLEATAARKLARACPDAEALAAVTAERARHFALKAWPPNDLGPTADLGTFPVGARTIALADPSRPNVAGDGPRPVTVEVYHPSTDAGVAGVPRDVVTVLGVPIVDTPTHRDVPVAAGPFPVVLFSHGNAGVRFQSLWLLAHLASHGYVVVSPDHHGNNFIDLFAGVVEPLAAAAVNRPLDMSFLLDQLADPASPLGAPLAGRVDLDRVGMSGHSFGGFTSFALAGEDATFMARDPRIDAILPLAPLATFSDAFLASITVPALIVGGTLDETTPFESQQQAPFDGLAPGALVVGLAALEGAGHFTFSDICEVPRDLVGLIGGFDEACEPRHLPWRHAHDIVSYLALNFFDAVLRADGAALGRLAPDVVDALDDVRYLAK